MKSDTCCPKCGKEYLNIYCSRELDRLPKYMQVVNYDYWSNTDGHGYDWTVAVTCTKCGTEFTFIDGSC